MHITFARRLSFFIRHYSHLGALTLLAIWPLLVSGIPTIGDGRNHFYRLSELAWHIQHGEVYPRWFADMHYGFGAPVLNYYAPFTYYLTLTFRLFTPSIAVCILLGYVLMMAVAVFGTYFWVRDQFDSALAGFVAAAAYGLAPYMYINIFHRGAYPELWGMALSPWLFWSAYHLVHNDSRRARLTFTLLYAVLILTHVVSTFILTPLVVVYLLALSLTKGSWRSMGQAMLRCSLFLAHSLALASFFLLPVLFESRYVQLFRTFLPEYLDYRRNFLTLATLFSPPPNFDPYLVANDMPASLGWPQAILAFAAIVVLLFARKSLSRAFQINFLICFSLFAASSFLTLSYSTPLWDIFPLARFIQFPWRLIGATSLLLAALAGAGLDRLAAFLRRASTGPALTAVTAFFFFSLSWTYHANFPSFPMTFTPADVIRHEITSGAIGTTSAGEYLPRWVSELPAPDTLLPHYAEDPNPSRFAPPPSGVTFAVSRPSLTSEVVTYNSSEPFTATFYTFYFPGWVAALDGRPAIIRVSEPGGLITVPVPTGQHTLRVWLQPTWPQFIGTLISFVALAVLVAFVFRRINQPPTANHQPSSSSILFVTAHCSLLIALIAFRALYFDRAETPFHYTSLHSLPNPISVNFDNQLELIGYQYPPTAVSGDALDLTFYWRALAPLVEQYATTVQLADRFGNRFGQSDTQHPGGVPTDLWQLDQYSRNAHRLVSLSGTPPGQYRLLVGVYAKTPLSVLADGAPVGTEYDLGSVTVIRAGPQPPGPLRLAGYDLASRTVTVGDQLAFTALWNSGDKPLPDLTARLLLADSANQTIFAANLPPAGEDYPTTQWTPNELIRYPFSVGLPPDLPGGPAKVSLLLLDANDLIWAGSFDLGTITILVPERSFAIPSMAHRVDYDFRGAIRLLGYDLTSDTIILYWQSLQPVSTRLTVFVHRLDANGAFVAGHDSPPPRPTTGWLPGEVLADAKPFAAGDRFEIGLYDPITGERFGEPLVVTR